MISPMSHKSLPHTRWFTLSRIVLCHNWLKALAKNIICCDPSAWFAFYTNEFHPITVSPVCKITGLFLYIKSVFCWINGLFFFLILCHHHIISTLTSIFMTKLLTMLNIITLKDQFWGAQIITFLQIYASI